MRTLWLVSGSLVLGFALGAGFTFRIKDVERETVSAVHNLDYFITDESFSEVHNARAMLAGLSRKFLTELRSRAWMESQDNNPKQNRSAENLSSASGLIVALEHGIEEFKGTEHELSLIPDLLRALKANGQFERWLEIYLATLYTHPTADLVVTFAREAVQMGTRAGRQEDVINGLRHVCSIPIEFPSKVNLQAAVLKLFPRPSVVQEEKLPNRISSLLASTPQDQSASWSLIEILEKEGEKQAVCIHVLGKSSAGREDGRNNRLDQCATPCTPLCFELEPGEQGSRPPVSTCVAKVLKACDKNIGPSLIQ
jgi:hypothetical protein